MLETPRRRGRPQKYPWGLWFEELNRAGKLWIRQGEDFDIPVETMRRSMLSEAKKRKIVLRSALQQNRTWIRFDVAKIARAYPWDKWLNGQPRGLVIDSDFTVDVEVMREQARRAAKDRGMTLRSMVRDGVLWIQAFPADQAEVA